MARHSNTKPVARQARAFGWSEATYVGVIRQLGDRFTDRAAVKARSLDDLLALRDARCQFLLNGLPAIALFTDYPRPEGNEAGCTSDDVRRKHLIANARLNLTALDKLIRLAGGTTLTGPCE